MPLEEAVDARLRGSPTYQRRDNLDLEDRRDDDRVAAGEERHAASECVRVAGLVSPNRGHGYRRVEYVPHRRLAIRSSTADLYGSAALNSSTNAETLRCTSSSLSTLARGRFGVATSTGTIAAAGLP